MDDTPAAKPLVFVIVLNWNGWRDTAECVSTLKNQHYDPYRLVVVDNGSTDGSEARLRERFPDITLLQTGANLGFAGGNNVGIQHALRQEADYIWIVNNDTKIPPGCLESLVGVMEREPRLGVLSPAVFHSDTRKPEPLNRFPPGIGAPRRFDPLVQDIELDADFETLDVAPGCAMLIRSGTVVDLGGFDERYFHYFEDTDFCWRAWSHGWLVARAPRCAISHLYGGSTRTSPALALYYMLRNILLFSSRVTGIPVWMLLVCRPILWVWSLGPLLGVRGFRAPQRKVAVIRALVDAIRGREGRCPVYSPP